MKKNYSIIIHKVSNGYMLRPFINNEIVPICQEFVFQEKGEVTSKTEKTLLGFLAEHFQDEVK